MALGRAGGAADAVPAGAAAQQNHHVAGGGTLPDHVLRRGSAYHGAHFQVLGNIAGIVDLADKARGKADLVAVAGVAGSGSLGQLALGELAGQGLGHRGAGIAAAGHPHGLVHIGPAGQRVPDAAADAGGGAAEGFDLRGVVVGLVLEHQQPVLRLPVHRGGDMDGAGVDLLALVQILEKATLFQHLCANGSHVHQSLGTDGGLLCAIDLLPGSQIPFIGGLGVLVQDLHGVDVGGEGGVAAVIGPIGVHHPDLRDGGVPVLVVPEVGLKEFQVVQVHGKAQLVQQLGKARLVQSGEAGDSLHGGGDLHFHLEGVHFLQSGLPGLHGVDDVVLDLLHVGGGQLAGEEIHLGGADRGPLALGEELDAGSGGVRPLVELARQVLHGKGNVILAGESGGGVIHLGLGEHRLHGPAEGLLVQALHIVAVEDPQPRQGGDPKEALELIEQPGGLLPQGGLFLYINAAYHRLILSKRAAPAVRCHGAGIFLQIPRSPRRHRRPGGPPPVWGRQQ